MFNLKKILLLLLFVILCSTVYSNELLYKVVKDANIYKIQTGKKTVGSISKGEKCKALDKASFLDISIRIKVEYNGIIGWVDSNKLKPFNSPDSFKKDIIVDDETTFWTISYYQDVIKSNNLMPIVENEPFLFDNIYDNDEEYLDVFSIPHIYFFNSVIQITNAYFLVKQIKYSDKVYYVDAKLVDREVYDNKLLNPLNDFKGELLTLILKIDGDYMDIYINDERTKLIELIKVDKNFVDSLYKVVKQESVDLSKINWPQRADKEQPEEDTTTKASKKNYYTPTVNNLRFRATPTLDGRFIRHLKAGERLELIERGKTETIGDVKGTWVKVKTGQGEVGWCFDAYLKELK